MNVYDFDNTIYDGDSSFDFIIWLYKKRPIYFLIYGIQDVTAIILYLFKIWKKEKVKETVFKVLSKFENKEKIILDFWNVYGNKIKIFYINQKKNDDLIISASPSFLIKPICDRLSVDCITSNIDIKTLKFKDNNCYGIKKVELFKKYYNDRVIDNFYTDSISDKPLIDLAENAYMVKGSVIQKIK